MHVYHEIAAKYGKVDYSDPEAVTQFFRETLPTLSDEIRLAISEELLARDGEKAKPVPRGPYPKNVPAPKITELLKIPKID